MPPIEAELRSAWEEDGHDRVPPLDLVAVRRRSRARGRQRAGVVGAAVAATLAGVVVVVQLASGPPAPVGPAEPTTSASPSAEPTTSASPSAEPTTEPPHGWARLASSGEFDQMPGDGWWTFDATPDRYDDERSLQHPDTVVVAGFADAVLEGWVRDPDTGVANRVPAGWLDPVPLDPDWPDHWLILDARTFEVVEVLPDPGSGTPPIEAFVEEVAASVGMTVERAQLLGERGVDVVMSDGSGVVVEYTVEPSTELPGTVTGDGHGYVQVEVGGVDARQKREAATVTTVALSGTGAAVHLTVRAEDPGARVKVDDERADELTAAVLPQLLGYDAG